MKNKKTPKEELKGCRKDIGFPYPFAICGYNPEGFILCDKCKKRIVENEK